MTTGTLKITGKPTVGSTLTVAPGTIADANGVGPISYKWSNALGDLSTNPTYILTPADLTTHLKVTATYLDFQGVAHTVTSPDILNRAHTGTIAINGTTTVGSTLTVSNTLKDADGLTALSYQWYDNGNAILNATKSTYKVAAATDHVVSVKVSYTDKLGYLESETKATVPVSVSNTTSAANDVLTSTIALDKLTGGLGSDTFKFLNAVTSGVTAKTRDVITDFNHSQGDALDLRSLGITSSAKFAGSTPTIGAVWFDADASTLYGSFDSDTTAEFSIQLTGVTVFDATDLKF